MNEFLQPSAGLGEYSLGADLVKLPPSRKYTISGIHRLRNRAANLCDYGDEDDNKGFETIGRYFNRNDFHVAEADLGNDLDVPLGVNIVEWISEASDTDIERFCVWSLERTLQLSRSLLRDKRELADHTLSKTDDLVEMGVFPPIAKPVIRAATERYYLQGIDAFHSGGMHRIAFCDTHRIGSSNLYSNRRDMTNVSKGMLRTLFHEYVHGGGSDRGFFEGITEKRYVRIIEEAFVEHATVVAHSHIVKQPRIIHPKKRLLSIQETSGTYIPERTFLAVSCEQTGISIEQLSEAYFSPRGDERGEKLRHEIERKIGKFFGSKKNFYDFIDYYEQLDNVKREGFVRGTLRQLLKHRD